MQLAENFYDEDDEDDYDTITEIRKLFKKSGILTELVMLSTPN